MGYGAGAKKLFALVLERRVLEAAASLAFRFFLSALPLLTLLGYALGELVRVRGVDALLDPLAVVLPDVTENLLREELTRLAGSSHPALAPLAIVGFLWLGSGGAHHLLNVLAAVVAAPRRPWLRQRALALALTVAALAAGSLYALARFELRALLRASSPRAPAELAAPNPAPAPPSPGEPAPTAFPLARHGGHGRTAAALAPEAPAASQERSPGDPLAPSGRPRRRRRRTREPWERPLELTAMLLLGTAALALFYRLAVPRSEGARVRLWPGALLATSSGVLSSWALGAYASSVGMYSLYYGSLAAVAVSQLWLFIASLALLAGAMLNAHLEVRNLNAD